MFITECEGMTYEERLRTTGLTTLETRRLKADMLKVYNILKGFEGADEMTFFQRRVGSTRGRDLKLFRKRVKLDVGKFSFGNRICDEWNRLPACVVNVEDVNKFKGNLDSYLNKKKGDFIKGCSLCPR